MLKIIIFTLSIQVHLGLRLKVIRFTCKIYVLLVLLALKNRLYLSN